MNGLCESAKKGRVCCDDICRGSDVTLCGFDPDLYAEITRDYESCEDYEDFPDEEGITT